MALSEEVKLSRGLYRIYGPLKMVVREGELFFLGRYLGPGGEVIVPFERTACIEVLSEEASVRLSKGVGGGYEEAKPEEEAILEWRRICEDIVQSSARRVVIVGEVDSGKSAFSAFLLNYALEKGLKTALVDADVGQNDVGYPGTVALAFPKRPIAWTRELSAEKLYFVGSITPSGNEEAVVLGAHTLAEEAERRADLVVVNTDGWVDGARARRYKIRLILSLRPDALVVMYGTGRALYLQRYFSRLTTVYVAKTPLVKLDKQRELRRFHRGAAYANLLMSCSRLTLSIDEAPLLGSYLFTGKAVDGEKVKALSRELGVEVVYAEWHGSQVTLVLPDAKSLSAARRGLHKVRQLLGAKGVRLLTPSDLKGILVGVLGEGYETLGVGIIQSLDFKSRKVHVLVTPLEGTVRGLLLGNVRIAQGDLEDRRVSQPI